jgi:hypothetical protein
MRGEGPSVPATVARRLERLEAAQRADAQRRHDAATRELGRTMAPEHIQFAQDWMRERFGSTRRRIALPGESPYATFERLNPPALVRAILLLLDSHERTGAPLSLVPAVAEVYLADQDAYPANPCDGCRYPLPIRGTVRPDGSFSDVIYYVGACPVCGLDTDSEEGAPT